MRSLMRSLPSMPLAKFTGAVFNEVIKLYARAAQIEFPKHGIDPCREVRGVSEELVDGVSFCEWRLGSHLTPHSKLFLHAFRKEGVVWVAFDIDPNTADDSTPQAVAMRECFHRITREYFDAIGIS